jgi:ribose transport system substrate-binding protein
MEDMLNAYPDGINLVLCHNDDTAIGALNAIQAAGAEGISIIGFDGNQSAIELIDAGDITATIAQQPALMGYESVMTAVAALKGEEVEENVAVDTVIIDSENCADYLAE